MSTNKKNWLIIGGSGYIGSHIARTFLKKGIDIIILDDFSTGLKERTPSSVKLINLNCSDSNKLNYVLNKYNVEGIVHLAALKQARESNREPLKYWSGNISSLIGTLNSLKNSPIKYFLFSSSCSIYGDSNEVTEESNLNPISTYGRTKAASEFIINDCANELDISYISLRYFNVIGNASFPMAHDNSQECLLPCIYRAFQNGNLPKVFGTDFNTKDGSALRDYIDVRDLSYAHYLSANYLSKVKKKVSLRLNVGTGKPYSVIEIIEKFAKNLNKSPKFYDAGRNPADPDAVWANIEKFTKLFNWSPKWTLDESIKSYINSKQKEI